MYLILSKISLIFATTLFHTSKNFSIFFVSRSFVIVSYIMKNRSIKKLNVSITTSSSSYFEVFDFAIEKTMSLFSKTDVCLTKSEKIDVCFWNSDFRVFDMIYFFFDVLDSLIDMTISSSSMILLRVWDRVFRGSTSDSSDP